MDIGSALSAHSPGNPVTKKASLETMTTQDIEIRLHELALIPQAAGQRSPTTTNRPSPSASRKARPTSPSPLAPSAFSSTLSEAVQLGLELFRRLQIAQASEQAADVKRLESESEVETMKQEARQIHEAANQDGIDVLGGVKGREMLQRIYDELCRCDASCQAIEADVKQRFQILAWQATGLQANAATLPRTSSSPVLSYREDLSFRQAASYSIPSSPVPSSVISKAVGANGRSVSPTIPRMRSSPEMLVREKLITLQGMAVTSRNPASPMQQRMVSSPVVTHREQLSPSQGASGSVPSSPVLSTLFTAPVGLTPSRAACGITTALQAQGNLPTNRSAISQTLPRMFSSPVLSHREQFGSPQAASFSLPSSPAPSTIFTRTAPVNLSPASFSSTTGLPQAIPATSNGLSSDTLPRMCSSPVSPQHYPTFHQEASSNIAWSRVRSSIAAPTAPAPSSSFAVATGATTDMQGLSVTNRSAVPPMLVRMGNSLVMLQYPQQSSGHPVRMSIQAEAGRAAVAPKSLSPPPVRPTFATAARGTTLPSFHQVGPSGLPTTATAAMGLTMSVR